MNEPVVRFWGVRGSIPVPGRGTAIYGGNTSCAEVRAGDQLFIQDLGSGLRGRGAELAGKVQRGTLLLSHYRWDHISGPSLLRTRL